MLTQRVRLVVWSCLLIGVGVGAAPAGAKKAVITFLDAKEAAEVMVGANGDDYLDRVLPLDMAAKTGSEVGGATIEEKRAELKKRYREGVRDFAPAEKAVVEWAVGKIQPFLEKEYPLCASLPWKFVKVVNTIEGGLSHTRGDCIVLSSGTLRKIIEARQNLSEAKATIDVCRLLLHERMHVLQRKYPKLFESLYIKVWGFEKAKKIEGAESVLAKRALNPDGPDALWVRAVKTKDGTALRYIWPLLVFDTEEKVPAMPGDFSMEAVEVEKIGEGQYRVKKNEDGDPVTSPLSPIREYAELFPDCQSIYHPNEAAADMFANMVVLDYLIPAETATPAGAGQPARPRVDAAELKERQAKYDKAREWFKANLKKAP